MYSRMTKIKLNPIKDKRENNSNNNNQIQFIHVQISIYAETIIYKKVYTGQFELKRLDIYIDWIFSKYTYL